MDVSSARGMSHAWEVPGVRRWMRGVVLVVVLLSVAFVVVELGGYLDLPAAALAAPPPTVYAQYAIALLAGTVAVVLAWTSRRIPGVPVMAFHLATLSLSHATMVDASGGTGPFHRGAQALASGLAVAAFVRFTALFPRELGPDGFRRARDELAGMLFPGAGEPSRVTRSFRSLQLVLVRRPWIVWAGGVTYGVFLYWMQARFASEHSLVMFDLSSGLARGAWAAHVVVFTTAILLGLSNLGVGHAYSGGEQRRRILWLVAGYTVAVFLFVAMAGLMLAATAAASPALWSLTNGMAFVVWPLTILVVMVCYLVSIFFRGAFDPSLVLRGTTIYGGLVVGLTFLFAGVESVVESQLTERFGLPEGVGTWVGAGAVALALEPLRRWLDGTVRRLAPVGVAEEGGEPGGPP